MLESVSRCLGDIEVCLARRGAAMGWGMLIWAGEADKVVVLWEVLGHRRPALPLFSGQKVTEKALKQENVSWGLESAFSVWRWFHSLPCHRPGLAFVPSVLPLGPVPWSQGQGCLSIFGRLTASPVLIPASSLTFWKLPTHGSPRSPSIPCRLMTWLGDAWRPLRS